MAPATSFCAWRNIGQQGTAILKRGWKFPVRNLEFFCNPPEWYTCILSTRRRLWGGRCRHAREHRLIHLPSQAQLIVLVQVSIHWHKLEVAPHAVRLRRVYTRHAAL